MDDYFKRDYRRNILKEWNPITGRLRMLKHHHLRFAYYGRKLESSKFLKFYYRILLHRYKEKYGLEIEYKNIEKGLAFIHPFNITINGNAKIGQDVTIFKGATIGSVRGGKNDGVPTIGDRVTICTNAFVCGNIKIGNDVLIASNAYVNFDVPDNSIVIGNPGFIKHKENPSKDFLI